MERHPLSFLYAEGENGMCLGSAGALRRNTSSNAASTGINPLSVWNRAARDCVYLIQIVCVCNTGVDKMSFLLKLIQTPWKALGVLVNCCQQEEDNSGRRMTTALAFLKLASGLYTNLSVQIFMLKSFSQLHYIMSHWALRSRFTIS